MTNSRIYIGKLSCDAQEKDVEKFFKRYGEIKEINLKNNRNSRYDCGFGFVEFNDYRDAEDAVKDCNDEMFLGHRITVELAHGEKRTRDDRRDDRRGDRDNNRYGPPQHTNNRIIVENLSSSVRWQELKDYFRKIGKVTFADAHKRREGEGVVEFENYDDMKDALRKLDETEINGRKIYLKEDSRSKRRSRSRSNSRSRSKRGSRYRYRSRSRSNSRSRSRSRQRSRHSHSHSKYRSRSPRSRTPRSNSHSRSRTPKSNSVSPRSRSHSPRSRSESLDKQSNSNQNNEQLSRSQSPMNQDSPQ